MKGENALGDFLKARRGRVRPDESGAPSFGRRRVPGLRRDELARLAGVSQHYLTRLEQGKDRNPSPQVLNALANALRLDRDERAHLTALATTAPPPGVGHTAVSDAVRQLVDSWSQTPAYVRDRRFDVLAANKLAMALSPLYTPGRNLVRGMFLDPAVRTLFPDWTEIAAQSAAALRAEADPRDPATAALISSLLADSLFREVWAGYDVRPTRDEVKRFNHEVVGPLTLRRETLAVAGAEGQVIIAYQAAPGTPAAQALARLL
ncbi:helix-turn-helix transcriptional regulator [Micromonospora sp. NPDC005298]|uniref:helix-turn-helix transcriptional regulator n=1 Tax=Micromonospora sp. NPDC005298 TaxID=3156873 RepID=UPI0033A794A5